VAGVPNAKLSSSRYIIRENLAEYIIGMIFYHYKSFKMIMHKNQAKNLYEPIPFRVRCYFSKVNV